MSGQCRTPIVAVLPTLTRESAFGKSRLTLLADVAPRSDSDSRMISGLFFIAKLVQQVRMRQIYIFHSNLLHQFQQCNYKEQTQCQRRPISHESASDKSRLASLGSTSRRDRVVTVDCHGIANVDS